MGTQSGYMGTQNSMGMWILRVGIWEFRTQSIYGYSELRVGILALGAKSGYMGTQSGYISTQNSEWLYELCWTHTLATL